MKKKKKKKMKAVYWIALLRKSAVFSNDDSIFSLPTTGITRCQDNFYESKKDIYKSSIVENMAMIVNKDNNIE